MLASKSTFPPGTSTGSIHIRILKQAYRRSRRYLTTTLTVIEHYYVCPRSSSRKENYNPFQRFGRSENSFRTLLRPGCREDFRWNSPHEKLGTQLRISVHGPLRPPSLSTPWLGMILILPLGPSPPEWLLSPSAPPPTPPVLGDSGWSGWPESHLTLLPREPLPRRPPKLANFPGDFLGEILAFPSNCVGTPQKFRAKIRANVCTNHSCKQSVQKSAPKNRARNLCRNPCRKSVQHIRAKNPCKKSVQKIRAENPCRKSVQKSVQKICAKQTRANGFPKVTLQIEKPNIL